MKIDEAVREMSPPRYTTVQAAELIGKSPDTLRRWRDGPEPVYAPGHFAQFGKVKVPLYTREDIQAMKRIAKTMRPGRKKINIDN